MIPVHVLTGFLGSGKTTLLRSLLLHPDMGRTAVIVNEFGEVGIDHELLATSDEQFVQLSNGCLCCQVRSDLVLTLCDLARRRCRDDGRIDFDRVVIETSGLADPVPVVASLMTDPEVRARFRLAGVVTTVDAVLGLPTLARYAESARQVGVADRVVLTKVDRSDAMPDDVTSAIGQIRPGIPVLRSHRGSVSPQAVFSPREASAGERASLEWAPVPVRSVAAPAARHSSGIGSVSIVRREPLRAATLPLFLSAMAEHYGPALLRLKGIVGIAERPDEPAVVHGVQHLYEVPDWLPGWPGPDRSTRIVCIGRGLHAAWIRMLLDLLDEDVGAAAGLSRRAIPATREDG